MTVALKLDSEVSKNVIPDKRFSPALLKAHEEVSVARAMSQAAFQLMVEALSSADMLDVLSDFLEKQYYEKKRVKDDAQGAMSPVGHERFDAQVADKNETRDERLLLNTYAMFDELGVLNAVQPRNMTEISFLCRRLRRAKILLSCWDVPAYIIVRDLYPRLCECRDKHLLKQFHAWYRKYVTRREKLVLANTGLVKSIAVKYKYLGLSFDELVQEGNLGLIKAADRFDYRLGYRFSSYAYRTIHQFIHYFVEKEFSKVRVPNPVMRHKQAVDELLHKLEQKDGEPVSLRTIAKNFDMQESDLSTLLKRSTRLSADFSADISFLADIEIKPDSGSVGGEGSVERAAIKENLLNLVSNLSERDRKILLMKYGVGYRKDYTLEEISGQFGISRERVRQIVKNAVLALRPLVN